MRRLPSRRRARPRPSWKIEEFADDSINVTAKPGTEGKITDRRDNNGNVTETTVKSVPAPTPCVPLTR
jgi:hypothetical protein